MINIFQNFKGKQTIKLCPFCHSSDKNDIICGSVLKSVPLQYPSIETAAADDLIAFE